MRKEYEDPIYYPIDVGYPGDNNEVIPENWFFNRDLLNEDLDVEIIERGKKLPLVISFSGFGINPDTNRAQYAMQQYLRDSVVNQICLRDQFSCWFHNGVMGASTDVASTVDYLKKIIEQMEPPRILCVGASGGAYSAILFGTLLNVSGVIALNPQTLLKRGVRCQAHGHLYALKWTDGDGTWNFTKQQYADLLDLPPSKVRIEIVYGIDSPVDVFHAERMDVLPNVKILAVPGDHSTAIVQTRDNGILAELFGDVMAVPIWENNE